MRHAALVILFLLVWGMAGLCLAQETVSRDNIHVHYYPPDADIAKRSMEILIDARDEFSLRLPLGGAPVQVTIADTFARFQQHTGRFSEVSVSGIAMPSKGIIVVQSPRIMSTHSDYHGTLRHELVHILLERNTNTDNLPKWMNEGLCMMLANEYHWESMFTIARMYTMGRIQEYEELDQNLLEPGDEMSFGDTYAQGLSMTRFLRDRLGEEQFWAVVLGMRDRSFPEALSQFGGITLNDFWSAYHNSLWQTAVLGSLGSGTLFGPAAILVIIAWFRMRGKNRETEERWQEEEETETGVPPIVSLDELEEGLYEWEFEDEEEESW